MPEKDEILTANQCQGVISCWGTEEIFHGTEMPEKDEILTANQCQGVISCWVHEKVPVPHNKIPFKAQFTRCNFRTWVGTTLRSYSSGVSREPGLPRAPVHQINHDGFSHDELNSPPEPQPQQIIYRVVGSRSHVKKSDSSQQTDSSLRNSQWKKYINSPERTTKLLSDESPSSSRSREKRPGQISRKNGRKKIGVFISLKQYSGMIVGLRGKAPEKLIDSYSSGVSREPGLPRAPVHQINHDGFSHDELNSPPEPQPQQIIYRVVGSRSHVKKSDSSQQTDSSLRNSQWKKYINSPERTTKLLSDESPSSSRSREKRPGQISRKNGRKKIGVPGEEQSLEDFNKMGERSRSRESSRENKTKVWGVPQSFRYVNKRPVSGSSKRETQTAQVSAVPRTKVKISGGTQTDMKSYFISSANSSPRRSSSNIRERVILASQSLPKGSTRLESGSLSDSNFTESAMHGRSNGDHHSSPLRHSSTYTAPLPMKAAGMSEAESIESLPAQLHQRTSLTHSRLISCGSPGPRLSRSNSIR
ncbi:uncharacterized protein LOC108252316 [Diaphorina citri]|uniref:Uncharacterized protein LOC108252316 n=1 Tax=Diaphorina citri TaxID=121845 RepID=A0A3Q0IRN4_DIACI|nr:uncharacterized protein LOC108252316 [Diaphorina citri]